MVDPDERLWEVDLARGLAVGGMVIYHLLFDLDFFELVRLDTGSGPWLALARGVAVTFLLLVGISLTLSHSRGVLRGKRSGFLKYLERGAKIFALGLVITAATRYFLGEAYVRFGVLHLIGLSVVLAYPLVARGRAALLLGAATITVGLYTRTLTVGFPWLLWLGLRPEGLYTVDYFPLLPWFGVVLLGVFLGNVLYPGYSRTFPPPDMRGSAPVRGGCLIGRRALLVYLVHQPLILAALGLAWPDVVALWANS